jgi:L-lactate utilization protein LutC
MTTRDARRSLLARVRAALARSGEWRKSVADAGAFEPAATETSSATVDELCARFDRALVAVQGRAHVVPSHELGRSVVAAARSLGINTFARWQTPLLNGIGDALEGAGLRSLEVVPEGSASRMKDLDLAVSEADHGIAATGSIVLSSGPGRSRLVTAIARHHFAILPARKLVANLDLAASLLGASLGANGRSEVAIVTGPTRTADIEGIMVLGAHGPFELRVFVVTEPT